LAARTQPSSAAIATAVAGLSSYVHSPLHPTSSEVATLGNDVCTAFDQGSTDAQVQTALTAALGKLPLTKVLPGAASYVVSSAVALYCPGYQSKLS
ncbi:MAG: DUF732 domain-containing protein, partial [Acidimicrobiales bacterium]